MTVPFFLLLFPCPVCRGHFRSFYHDEILQQELMNVQTKPGAMFFAWKVHDVVTAWGVLFHEGSTSLTTYNRPQSGMKGRTSTIIGHPKPTSAIGGQTRHVPWYHVSDFKSRFCSGS